MNQMTGGRGQTQERRAAAGEVQEREGESGQQEKAYYTS